jgi:hypothetical protein
MILSIEWMNERSRINSLYLPMLLLDRFLFFFDDDGHHDDNDSVINMRGVRNNKYRLQKKNFDLCSRNSILYS